MPAAATRKIKDRFDLTLECIRRHYACGQSPLSEVLARYDKFFRLFESFQGYVEFFLLQDLVRADYSAVRFSAPFNDFAGVPLSPDDPPGYLEYRDRAAKFIADATLAISAKARRTRITDRCVMNRLASPRRALTNAAPDGRAKDGARLRRALCWIRPQVSSGVEGCNTRR